MDNSTLTRFFAFHFILPFLVRGIVILHFLFLHETGSNNPLGVSRNKDKIPFHPYFTKKDLLGGVFVGTLYLILVFRAPYALGDPENFIPANSLVTPAHIQPEWYFLFAYAILRAIPNKLGGVVALAIAIIILFIMPFLPKSKFQPLCYYPLGKFMF